MQEQEKEEKFNLIWPDGRISFNASAEAKAEAEKEGAREATPEEIEQKTKEKMEMQWQYQVNDAFGKEKPVYQRLGIGIHVNPITNKREFYFGTTDAAGHSTVITSEKKYFKALPKLQDEIKEKFGLNYRGSFEESSLDFSWSNKAITEYLLGNYKKREIKEIFEEIVKLHKEFFVYSDKRFIDFFACDIISEYGLPIYTHKARVQFRGASESGKTKQLRMYWVLGFNSFTVSSTSDSDLFRSIEGTCGSPRIDNFDNVADELKKAVAQNYETGYEKAGYYRRREKVGNTFGVGKFGNFCNLTLTGLVGLESETIENRSFCFDLIKPPTKDAPKKTKEKMDKWIEDEPRFEAMRNDLRNWFLDNWQQVEEIYKTLKIKEIAARDLEISKPILTIAKLVGENCFNSVKSLILEKLEAQKVKDLENDLEFQVLIILDKQCKKLLEFTTGQLITWFMEVWHADIDNDDALKKKLIYKYQKNFPKMLKLTGKIKYRIGHGTKTIFTITRKNLDFVLLSRGYKQATEQPIQPNQPIQPIQYIQPIHNFIEKVDRLDSLARLIGTMKVCSECGLERKITMIDGKKGFCAECAVKQLPEGDSSEA